MIPKVRSNSIEDYDYGYEGLNKKVQYSMSRSLLKDEGKTKTMLS